MTKYSWWCAWLWGLASVVCLDAEAARTTWQTHSGLRLWNLYTAAGDVLAQRTLYQDVALDARTVAADGRTTVGFASALQFAGQPAMEVGAADGAQRDWYVPGVQGADVRVPYAFVEARGVARRWDLAAGRMVHFGYTGTYLVDGAQVALHLHRSWTVTAWGGMAVQASHFLGVEGMDWDGVDDGGAPDAAARDAYPDRRDGTLDPVVSAALDGRFARGWFGLGAVWSPVATSVGAAGRVGGPDAYVEMEARSDPLRDDWSATGWRAGRAVRLARCDLHLAAGAGGDVLAGYARRRPEFDPRSVFAVFDAGARDRAYLGWSGRDNRVDGWVRGGVSWAALERWVRYDLAARAAVRTGSWRWWLWWNGGWERAGVGTAARAGADGPLGSRSGAAAVVGAFVREGVLGGRRVGAGTFASVDAWWRLWPGVRGSLRVDLLFRDGRVEASGWAVLAWHVEGGAS